MHEGDSAQDLIQQLHEEISLDVFAVFEGDETKHLLSETIIGTVIAGLVLEYLKGFLNPKETGNVRSRSLTTFFSGVRAKQPPDVASLRTQVQERMAELRTASSSPRHVEATSSFATDLVTAGLDETSSRTIAEAVARAVAATRKRR